MIEIYFKTLRDGEYKRISDARAGSWLYAHSATLEDLQKIGEVIQIDPNELKDALDKYELPRIEHVGENVLFYTRHPGETEFGLYTETLTLILTNAHVIAITPTKSEIIETLLHTPSALTTTQKSKLILHILLKITQEFTFSIKRVRHAIIAHEGAKKAIEDEAIAVLTKNEEILNQYLTALVPMRGLLETLATGRYVNLYEKDYDLLEDLMIAMKQSEDLCRVNVKSIRSLRDSYQILFTNDVNRTIKRLTALTIVITIPTIIASIYGMNVSLPYQGRPWAFLAILIITAIVSVFSLLLFRKNRWI